MHYPAAYTAAAPERDRFVLALRNSRPRLDAWRYQDVFVEDEPTAEGRIARVARFLASLARHAVAAGAPPRLEVAMGLETAHPDALDKLNKRMTVDDFVRAADRLRQRDVALRVFLLIAPPGIPSGEQYEWL